MGTQNHYLQGIGDAANKRLEWKLTGNKNFLVPVVPLGRIFRAIFLSMVSSNLPELKYPEEVWKTRWVVFCKPTVKGAANVQSRLAL